MDATKGVGLALIMFSKMCNNYIVSSLTVENMSKGYYGHACIYTTSDLNIEFKQPKIQIAFCINDKIHYIQTINILSRNLSEEISGYDWNDDDYDFKTDVYFTFKKIYTKIPRLMVNLFEEEGACTLTQICIKEKEPQIALSNYIIKD